MRRALRIVPVLLLLSPPVGAQEAWLPPPVAEGLAAQLAERMRTLGEGEPDEERLTAGAQGVVGSLAEQLEAWGLDGVHERAPSLPGFTVPPAGNRHLEAMARYHVCIMVLYLQLEDPAFADDANARVTSVFGLTALTMAVVRLREPFVADGGDDTAIEAYLAGPALEPILAALQTDPAARSAAEESCRPVVVQLLEEPLSQLGAP